ncbi:MAG: hypothetical protein ACYTGC_13660, partial [Planctomycetota bacterium]
MKWFAPSLWDLLCPAPSPARRRVDSPPRRRTAMQRRYDEVVLEMKRLYGIRVRKWRSSTSGCAWEVRDAAGSVGRLIEAPYPRGPMSCAVFLHEVGHHAIGFGRY